MPTPDRPFDKPPKPSRQQEISPDECAPKFPDEYDISNDIPSDTTVDAYVSSTEASHQRLLHGMAKNLSELIVRQANMDQKLGAVLANIAANGNGHAIFPRTCSKSSQKSTQPGEQAQCDLQEGVQLGIRIKSAANGNDNTSEFSQRTPPREWGFGVHTPPPEPEKDKAVVVGGKKDSHVDRHGQTCRQSYVPKPVKEIHWWPKLVKGPVGDFLSAVFIFSNAILIGIITQHKVEHAHAEFWMEFVNHCCSFFFLVELCCRFSVDKINLYLGEDKWWNFFDLTLVSISVFDFFVEFVLGGSASTIGSVLRTARVLRTIRIFKVFRFAKELTILAWMIADSFKSLVWAIVMIGLIIYFFAVCFTVVCSDYTRANPHSDNLSQVKEQFGGLHKSVYYLILTMLGGVEWGEVMDTLLEVSFISASLFFIYITFSMLAVLNIITGVFVENAVATAKTHKDFLVEQEAEMRRKMIEEVNKLFRDIDEDQSGTVCWEEIMTHIDDNRMKAFLVSMNLRWEEMHRIFQMIDSDGSGDVDVEEWIAGCTKIGGEARSIDIHEVLCESRRTYCRCLDIEEYVTNLVDYVGLPQRETKTGSRVSFVN